jgi:hypothetical protein
MDASGARGRAVTLLRRRRLDFDLPDVERLVAPVTSTLKKNDRALAGASGNQITGSVTDFKDHAHDVGAMVHETVHVMQHDRGQTNPSWLVEGVSDYVRFFRFEPGKFGPIDTNCARNNSSYRVKAAIPVAWRFGAEISEQTFANAAVGLIGEGKPADALALMRHRCERYPLSWVARFLVNVDNLPHS